MPNLTSAAAHAAVLGLRAKAQSPEVVDSGNLFASACGPVSTATLEALARSRARMRALRGQD